MVVQALTVVFVLVLVTPISTNHQKWVVDAVVAYPGLWTSQQPDGTSTGITSMLIGSAEYHYVVVETDSTNFPALRGVEDDMLYYATIGHDGRFLPTNLLVGEDIPDDYEWVTNVVTSTTSEVAASEEQQDDNTNPSNDSNHNNQKNLVSALQEKTHAIHAQCLMSDYCKWKAYQKQIQVLNSNQSQSQDGNNKQLDSSSSTSSPIMIKTTGTVANLVIPFKFMNHDNDDSNHPITSIEDLDMKLFNGPYLTVRDYFYQQSYSQLEVISEILPWITIPYTEEECAHRQSGLSRVIHTCLEAALQKALPLLKDGAALLLDNPSTTTVTFVHSGYSAEYGGDDPSGTWYEDRIWSHSWEMSTPTYQGRYALISDKYDRKNAHINRVGVAVHELAQVFGAPTLHGGFPGYGLGYFDMLANPWGFDGTLR
jgi:M6 family metalloprotease-like protein